MLAQIFEYTKSTEFYGMKLHFKNMLFQEKSCEQCEYDRVR